MSSGYYNNPEYDANWREEEGYFGGWANDREITGGIVGLGGEKLQPSDRRADELRYWQKLYGYKTQRDVRLRREWKLERGRRISGTTVGATPAAVGTARKMPPHTTNKEGGRGGR